MTKSTTNDTKQKRGTSAPLSVIRGALAGTAVLAALIFIIPMILMKSSTPEKYITLACAVTVSLTALAVSAFAGVGSTRHYALTAIASSFAMIMLLILVHLALRTKGEEVNYVFAGTVFTLTLVFSFIGARLSAGRGGKGKSSSRSRRKQARK